MATNLKNKLKDKLTKTTETTHNNSAFSQLNNVVSDEIIDNSAVLIEVDKIIVNRLSRTTLDQETILDLALEISKSKTLQPKEPITVFKQSNGSYLLDDGEHRLSAFKILKENIENYGITKPDAFKRIRATLLDNDTDDELELRVSQYKSNRIRNENTIMDTARLAKEYLDRNPDATHEECAAFMGFSNLKSGRAQISKALSLLDLDDDIREQVEKSNITPNKARSLQKQREKEKRKTDKNKNENINENSDVVNLTDEHASELSNHRKKTISINYDNIILASKILHKIAEDKGINHKYDAADKKLILSCFNENFLNQLMEN